MGTVLFVPDGNLGSLGIERSEATHTKELELMRLRGRAQIRHGLVNSVKDLIL